MGKATDAGIGKINEHAHTPPENETKAPELLDDKALEEELRNGEALYELGLV